MSIVPSCRNPCYKIWLGYFTCRDFSHIPKVRNLVDLSSAGISMVRSPPGHGYVWLALALWLRDLADACVCFHSNWPDTKSSGYDCVFMEKSGSWSSDICRAYWYHWICEKPQVCWACSLSSVCSLGKSCLDMWPHSNYPTSLQKRGFPESPSPLGSIFPLSCLCF